MAQVARDPFARGEYHRETQPRHRYSCDWCGRTPRHTFTYVWQGDGDLRPPTRPTDGRTFCGLGCFRAFHGG